MSFWNSLHQERSKSRLEGQIIQMSLGERKPKGPNKIAKFSYGHLWPREENLTWALKTRSSLVYLCIVWVASSL